MNKLTKEQRNELRALEEKAAPGPWESWTSGKFGITAIKEIDDGDEYNGRGNLFSCGGDRSDDAALIAAARNALPALLDAVDRAEELEVIVKELVDRSEALIKDYCGLHDNDTKVE